MPEMKTLTVNGVKYDLRDTTKAPAGYGLGEADGCRAPGDLNDATTIGFYRVGGAETINYPSGNSSFRYGTLLVERRGNQIHQTIRYGNDVAIRWRNRDTLEWSEWVYCSPSAFAPAGYGLGVGATTISNWNDAKSCGWYRANNNSPNGYYWTGEVIATGTGVIIQRVFYPVSGGRWECIRLGSSDGTFEEWEWVNPPMDLGVEYRTTERWNGKEVYAKSMTYTPTSDIGSPSGVSSGFIPHGISNFGSLVRIFAQCGEIIFPLINSAGGTAFVNSVNSSGITIRTNNRVVSANTAIAFTLHYTKTS